MYVIGGIIVVLPLALAFLVGLVSGGEAAVSADNSAMVTIRYQIPAGIHNFRSTVFGTQTDPCGNIYYYPSPM